jgi:hypothetical protein
MLQRTHRWLGLVLIIALAVACRPAGTAQIQDPKVTLARVEVVAYYAWPTPTPAPPPPAPDLPLGLAYIFKIENPNDVTVTLDQLKFTAQLEAKKDGQSAYFSVHAPLVDEDMSIPPRTTNELRVTFFLSSRIVTTNLAVTSGHKLNEMGLTPGAVVKAWWEGIGDYAFGIRAAEGTAIFRTPAGDRVVTFEGEFRK